MWRGGAADERDGSPAMQGVEAQKGRFVLVVGMTSFEGRTMGMMGRTGITGRLRRVMGRSMGMLIKGDEV